MHVALVNKLMSDPSFYDIVTLEPVRTSRRQPAAVGVSPAPRFENCVAIDWSGAKGRRHKGIAIAEARDGMAPRLVRPDHVWSRCGVLDWDSGFRSLGDGRCRA